MNRDVAVNSANIQRRLEQLRADLEKGQRRIDLLDHQRQELRDTLLRISGAIQVLEEMMPQPDTTPARDPQLDVAASAAA